MVRPIAQGGMATIYAAEHLRLGQQVAIKVIRADLDDRPHVAAQLRREALSLSRLEHPNCVRVIDIGRVTEGAIFLAMELIEGRSLGELLTPGRPIPVVRSLHIFSQVLLALRHAHGAGVLHCDLKPDNVMITCGADGQIGVKVFDFGLARAAQGGSLPEWSGLLELPSADEGLVIGTPDYLAPELIEGDAPSESSDLYAAGVLLFTMLTGRKPFNEPTSARLLRAKLDRPAPTLDDVVPGVFAPALTATLARALERYPEHRHSDADVLLREVLQIRRSPGGGLRVAQTRRSLVARAWEWLGRRGLLRAIGGRPPELAWQAQPPH